MAIDEPPEYAAVVAALDAADWSGVLDAVRVADNWIRGATLGDPRLDKVVSKLVILANHTKWEIRRAVANAAGQAAHPAFEPVLAKFATDDNARVRQAAEHAALRRRDWRHASALGKQHEERINSTLDDIEVRFGSRGRDAVKRASEQIANTFARELYHEVIKLLSPLAMSADRLRTQLSDDRTTRTALLDEAARIERRVIQLRAVLDAMRAYTDHPPLTFTREALKDIVEEAASLALEGDSSETRPTIEIQVPATITVEIARARLVQAITNVLVNAAESYAATDSLKPIVVRSEPREGHVLICIEDSGCGMSEEALADASTLFATSKPNGTGFGLPLAIKIIESEHGGRLSIESTKGRGTVVRVVVPAHREQDYP